MAAPWLVPEMSAWNRRGLTIPPDSWRAWMRLAVWEFWMGLIIGGAVLFGVQQIVTAQDHIVTVDGFNNCTAVRVAQPCQHIVYRIGGLNALFSIMTGVLLLVIAAWLLWELWMAVKPRPIADDFLKLLHDSFARDWRNPRTWPWARLGWAYGFTSLGAASLVTVSFVLWSMAASSPHVKPTRGQVHNSHSVKVH